MGLPVVLEADSAIGLSVNEDTIPDLLKRAGYATGMVGKWHLGDRPQILPIQHGFDEYFGIPYSNDQWPRHPTKKIFFPDLPLKEQDQVIEFNRDQSELVCRYTERAVQFIERNQAKPFFLYLAHHYPHVPLFVSERFRGKSERGLYGDIDGSAAYFDQACWGAGASKPDRWQEYLAADGWRAWRKDSA